MHIPEARFAHGTHDTEVVDLTDMQYEYALLSARLDLLRRDNTVLSDGGKSCRNCYDVETDVKTPDFFLSPSLIVLRLIHSSRFNMAMATARSLDVDMTDLFAHLTGQCLRLSRDPDSVM
jgi:nuclear pore complex protein Nup160